MSLRPTDQPSQPVQPAQPTPATPPQPWVKPTFAQVPLNDALAGGALNNDGGFNYSS